MTANSEVEMLVRDQGTKNAATWQVLEKNGVVDGQTLCVDYFFYTKRKKNAIALRDYIAAETSFSVAAESRGFILRTWCILGQTPPMPVSLSVLNEFTEKLVQAGARFGCEFDGWGAALD